MRSASHWNHSQTVSRCSSSRSAATNAESFRQALFAQFRAGRQLSVEDRGFEALDDRLDQHRQVWALRGRYARGRGDTFRRNDPAGNIERVAIKGRIAARR